MKYLITGGCGFVGSNLAAEVLKRGEELIVFDNLFRFGTEKNLEWLRSLGKFTYYHHDIRNYNDVEYVIRKEKPDAVFHLAGQVAMTTSIDNPRLDFEINAFGTNNLLESIRKFSPESAILYSSTNKVYGDLEQFNYEETDTRYICEEFPKGFNESVTLEFHSPYGCSKGSADQYLLDYSRIFGLKTAVFRHSSMYGGRQFATYDQGWIGWFCEKALEVKKGNASVPFTISGSGKQVRDVLYASDIVNLYFTSLYNIEKIQGEAFNIGGGIENSLSLLELFKLLEELLDIKMSYSKLPWRISDQKVFVADNTKITELTGWEPQVKTKDGIKRMIHWLSR